MSVFTALPTTTSKTSFNPQDSIHWTKNCSTSFVLIPSTTEILRCFPFFLKKNFVFALAEYFLPLLPSSKFSL